MIDFILFYFILKCSLFPTWNWTYPHVSLMYLDNHLLRRFLSPRWCSGNRDDVSLSVAVPFPLYLISMSTYRTVKVTENLFSFSPGRVQLYWSVIGTDICNDGWRAELWDFISGIIQSGTSSFSFSHLLCFCALYPPHANPSHELDGMKLKFIGASNSFWHPVWYRIIFLKVWLSVLFFSAYKLCVRLCTLDTFSASDHIGEP